MKKNLLKSVMFSAALVAVVLTGCKKNNGSDPDPVDDGTRWITLTASQSIGGTVAAPLPPTSFNGNGGTLAFGITHQQAIDPNYVLDIYPEGKGLLLTSPRTSRVQVSDDGKLLWDIQYTGADAGLFQTFTVGGEGRYKLFGREVNTQPILGDNPRWVKSTDQVGIGVNSDGATLTAEYDGIFTPLTPNLSELTFKRNVRTVAVAILNLQNPGMVNTRQVPVSFPDDLAKQGYTFGRTDVALVNKAQTKIYIAVAVSKYDVAKPTLNASGQPQWTTNDLPANNTINTATIVLDYPTLRNPKIIFAKNDVKGNNHSYRTKTQYVGTDGHVYQAVTANGANGRGSKIVRINSATDDYDDYLFDLNTALGVTGTGIMNWTYGKDGKGVLLYQQTGVVGGRVAIIDLNAKTAKRVITDEALESDANSDFGQHQNVGIVGDFAYLPLTPHTKDGQLFVINWKTGDVIKGAKLKGYAFAKYIASY